MHPKTLALLTAICLSSVSLASGPAIEVKAKGPSGPVGLSMAYLIDTTATFSIEQVAGSSAFQPCTTEVPLFGLTKNANWLRFTVENATPNPAVLLSIPYTGIDELDVFVQEPDGFAHVARTGLSRDQGEMTDRAQEFILPITITPGHARTVYLRLHGFKHIHAPVLLTPPGAMDSTLSSRQSAIGAYIGIMLVLALYNLFVYVSTRDKSYFLYVLSILALAATQLTLQGNGPFDLFHVNGWTTSRAGLIFNLLAIPLGLEFARRFIGTRQYAPWMHRATPVIYVVLGCIAGVYLLVDPWLGQNLGNAFSGISALYLVTMTVVALRRGSRQARFFLLAWTGFLVGVVLFVLKDEGVLPYNTLTVYAMPVGSAIEGVLLSFGLADRINILRKEKERSQAEALASAQENERMIRDQNVVLEQRVTERTQQLQESLDHLKRTQSQLVEAERMSSLGQLTAGIAHEINNPINYIRSNIPPLKRDMSELLEVLAAYRAHGTPKTIADLEARLGIEETIDEVHQILRSMEDGANRSAEIVRGLRTFSRLDEGDLKYADINEGVQSTLHLLGSQMNGRVSVELDLRAAETVECLPGKVNQVFMNVLNNAVQAVLARHGDSGGRISVVTEQQQEHLIVTITDNGVGMNEQTRARVFEPFFTTKEVGEGTGLGMSIAHSIIEKHHGRIEVDSILGQGTEFRIVLPNTQPAQVAQRA